MCHVCVYVRQLARDAASYKRPLLSDAVSVSDSAGVPVFLSAEQTVASTSLTVASQVAYRLVRLRAASV